MAVWLNYFRCSTDTEPYVYVQTYNDIFRLDEAGDATGPVTLLTIALRSLYPHQYLSFPMAPGRLSATLDITSE